MYLSCVSRRSLFCQLCVAWITVINRIKTVKQRFGGGVLDSVCVCVSFCDYVPVCVCACMFFLSVHFCSLCIGVVSRVCAFKRFIFNQKSADSRMKSIHELAAINVSSGKSSCVCFALFCILYYFPKGTFTMGSSEHFT